MLPRVGHTRGVNASKKPEKSPKNTKQRILDAALETVRREGLVGSSARAIAKTGDFNQALVFYHFGSVEELLLAALQRAQERRIARVGDELNAVDDLAGLVKVATKLHGGPDDPDASALSAIVAGWSASSDVGVRVLETLAPWNEMVEAAISRALESSPFKSLVAADDAAYLVTAMFLGIEMMTRLDPTDTKADEIFASLAGMAKNVQPLL